MTDFSKAWDSIKDQCFSMQYAMIRAFGGFQITPEGGLKARCCGKIKYYSGMIGSDMAQCEGCGREIRHVLSPHVSPILIGYGGAYKPTAELIEAVGEREWYVHVPAEAAQELTDDAN